MHHVTCKAISLEHAEVLRVNCFKIGELGPRYKQ